MKKSMMMAIVLALLVLFVPVDVSAKAPDLSRYQSETLEEVFEQEGIDYDFSTSKYSDKGDSKPVIYLFRQNGCLNCKNFLNYMKDTLLPKYGANFRVVSFELKDHPINFSLLNELAAFFNVKSTTYTTPFIIINDNVFQGHIDAAMKEEIEENVSYSKTYDVMEEMDKGITNVGDSAQRDFFDEESGVLLLSRTVVLKRKYKLKATQIDLSHVKMEGYKYWKAYEIDMYDGDQIVPLNSGGYGICIPRNTIMDPDTKVAYIKDDKIVEETNAIMEIGEVCFETPHLSQYAIYNVEKDTDAPNDDSNSENNDNEGNTEDTKNPTNNQKEEKEPNPYTADPLLTYVGIFGIGIMILFGGMIVYFDKKEQN